jgi:multidrug efflux pump subunit AcrA (membrane-fusion protein)
LAQLDPSTYEAQLHVAEADLARDEAHLENGRINLGRYVPLAKQGFAAEQQVSTQQAKIAQEQATITADQAAIEYARTELGYTKLAAPFDGVAGIRLLYADDRFGDHAADRRRVQRRHVADPGQHDREIALLDGRGDDWNGSARLGRGPGAVREMSPTEIASQDHRHHRKAGEQRGPPPVLCGRSILRGG